MANTTNYNWETPDDTDLVKDGAAAIRTLGSSVDTTTKALNPSTTLGDIEYRSATANTNTRLPIGTTGQILSVVAGVPSWVANDVGDITEVQAGTGISVASGTGPVPVITNTVATTIDAAGDLLYGTAADTVGRLAIGTAGQVLKVNSGATAPEWGAAGGASFAGCILYNTGSQSISNNTDTKATFDSETLDTDGFHSTSTNTSRITIPTGKAGKYYFFAFGSMTGNATGIRAASLWKNNSAANRFCNFTSGGSTAFDTVFNINGLVSLAEGDYVELVVIQTSGTSLNLFGTAQERQFGCAYLGA